MQAHPVAVTEYRHVHPSPMTLNKKPLIGNGDCVTLVRSTIDSLKNLPTWEWEPGALVLETKDLVPGTAIATFFCGKYPQDGTTGKHAAIFIRYMGPPNPDGTYNSFMVLDQWKTRPTIATRILTKKGRITQNCTGGLYDASNTADAFYVIK